MKALFSKYGYPLYWIIALADILLISLNNDNYRIYSKSFLVPVLALTVFTRLGFVKHKQSKIIILLAFIAATAGDILLLKNTGFQKGLLCFLAVLLLYTIYFFTIQGLRLRYVASTLILAILLAAFFATFIALLWNYLEGYQIPLVVYSVFLSVMFISAVNVYHNDTTKNLALEAFIPSALLFIISDATLALNKFFLQENFLNIVVMATYCAAQFYISRGVLRHLQRRTKRRESRPAVT